MIHMLRRMILCITSLLMLFIAANAMGEAAQENQTEAVSFFMMDNGTRVDLDVEYLGTVYTQVTIKGQSVSIPTSSLQWDNDESVPEKTLATVTADIRGYTPLLTKASRRAPVIMNCYYGRVMLVLDYSATYCKLWADGKVGYARTNNLAFYPRQAEAFTKGERWGTLTAKKNDTVTLRARRDLQSVSVTKLPVGTRVLVLGHKDDFYLVEAQGYHGYIPEKKLNPEWKQ